VCRRTSLKVGLSLPSTWPKALCRSIRRGRLLRVGKKPHCDTADVKSAINCLGDCLRAAGRHVAPDLSASPAHREFTKAACERRPASQFTKPRASPTPAARSNRPVDSWVHRTRHTGSPVRPGSRPHSLRRNRPERNLPPGTVLPSLMASRPRVEGPLPVLLRQVKVHSGPQLGLTRLHRHDGLRGGSSARSLASAAHPLSASAHTSTTTRQIVTCSPYHRFDGDNAPRCRRDACVAMRASARSLPPLRLPRRLLRRRPRQQCHMLVHGQDLGYIDVTLEDQRG
jgi:hypothetical protein